MTRRELLQLVGATTMSNHVAKIGGAQTSPRLAEVVPRSLRYFAAARNP